MNGLAEVDYLVESGGFTVDGVVVTTWRAWALWNSVGAVWTERAYLEMSRRVLSN